LIARLYDATSGTISVAGTDVRKLEQDSLRRTVGYVTQDAHMFHDTIRANLRTPGRCHDAELWEALEARSSRRWWRACPIGLDTW
jgi:ATP-binding cassette subfamily B protein